MTPRFAAQLIAVTPQVHPHAIEPGIPSQVDAVVTYRYPVRGAVPAGPDQKLRPLKNGMVARRVSARRIELNARGQEPVHAVAEHRGRDPAANLELIAPGELRCVLRVRGRLLRLNAGPGECRDHRDDRREDGTQVMIVQGV